MAAQRPIIIKKKKAGGHGGHHGGAWKVAYADFVTAMMAFFLVMWIMGLSDSTRKGISGYFKEPGVFSFTTGKALPIDLGMSAAMRSTSNNGGVGEGGKGKDAGTKVASARARLEAAKQEMSKAASELKKELEQMAKGDSKLAKLSDAVTFEMTPEGLRIELAESRDIAFFEVGGANASGVTSQVLALLAPELKRLGAQLDIEGHTDHRPYDSHGYTNWELSADRANAARKILLANGLPDSQIRAVTGFADRKLRKPDEPYDVANRRVSIIVRYSPDSPTVELETLPGGVDGKEEAPAQQDAERPAEGEKNSLEGWAMPPPKAKAAEPAGTERPREGVDRERAVEPRDPAERREERRDAPAERPRSEGHERERTERGATREPPSKNIIGPIISPAELEGAYRRPGEARRRN